MMNQEHGHHNGTVSVITPCYNGDSFVAETIESVLRQDYPSVEHIVIDDGSTDGSWEVIKSFGEDIRAVRQPNQGACHVRNRGAQMATGEYLMFLDADDILAPLTLSALVETLEEKSDASIAAAPWKRLVYDDGEWVEHPCPKSSRPPNGDPIEGWLTHWFVPPCGLLWHRSAYERTGGWDESLRRNQDGDLMLRAFIEGEQLVFSDDGLAYYRNHEGTGHTSVGKRETYASLCSSARVMIKAKKLLESRGKLDSYAPFIGCRLHDIARRAFALDRRFTPKELCRIDGWARLARQLAGADAIQGSWMHQLVCRCVGLRRKQRLSNALRRLSG
jgi:glycosyltransferase involved in cell wall biosynthesis